MSQWPGRHVGVVLGMVQLSSLSMLLLLCVLKWCPEAMDLVETHLVTGTVPTMLN